MSKNWCAKNRFLNNFRTNMNTRRIEYLGILKILVVKIFIGISFHGNAQGSKIDFTGLDAFWKVVSQLKQGDQPSDTEWEQFFANRYYSHYSYGSATQKTFIRGFITTAFSPEKRTYLDSILKGSNNNYLKQMYLHVIEAEKSKNELQVLISKIKQYNFEDSIKAICQQLLPRGITKTMPPPIISFGIYQPDANGDTKGVYFDLKLALDVPNFLYVLAHEAHHYYTYRSRLRLNTDSTNETLVNIISQLQVEGIADQIDKPGLLNSNGSGFPASLYNQFYTHYTNPIPNLKRMDSLLVQIFHHPKTLSGNSKLIHSLLPLGTHPYAFYMSETIKSVHGNSGLIGVVNNPFDFIKLYNETAKKKGLFYFSSQSMSYLSELEKEVIK